MCLPIPRVQHALAQGQVRDFGRSQGRAFRGRRGPGWGLRRGCTWSLSGGLPPGPLRCLRATPSTLLSTWGGQECARSVPRTCPTLCDPVDRSLPGSSAGKNAGVGCHGLLQGIVLTQGLNTFRALLSLPSKGGLVASTGHLPAPISVPPETLPQRQAQNFYYAPTTQLPPASASHSPVFVSESSFENKCFLPFIAKFESQSRDFPYTQCFSSHTHILC